jgi:ataxia telangiectasia mutated family protein
MQQTQPLSLLLGDSASHLQQQQHQQQVHSLLEAQQELAWRLSDWGLANSLNPAAAQQGSGLGFSNVGGSSGGMLVAASQAAVGSMTSSGPGQQGQGFHAAVSAALTALQQRDYEGFSVHVTSAQQGCVLKLAGSSTQSAAAVNPLLVQLQMLQMLSSGLAVAKRLPAAAAVVGPAAADLQQQGAQEILEQLLPPCATHRAGRSAPESAIKLSGSSFQLSDQLLSLQAALTKALHRPDALLATLEATMSIARKAGQVNFAAAALQQLQESLHQAVLGARLSAQGLPAALGFALPGAAGGAGSTRQGLQLPGWMQQAVASDAGWALEAVKVRWLQGQHQTALNELQGLAAGLQTQLQGMYSSITAASRPHGQQQTPEQRQAHDRLRSVACAHMQARMLLGKWLAAGEGNTCNIQSAMEHLQSASRLAPEHVRKTGEQPSQQMQALHSRVCYQLATCADQHYQMLDVQLSSPEFQKQQQLLQKKEQDLQQLRHAYDAARNWQRLPTAKQASARVSAAQVQRRYVESERQTNLDKRAMEQLQEAHSTYLSLALTAYKDCIQSGDRYDLEVVYRMCGLWFKHSDSSAANEVMAQIFPTVPTAKFVLLVYQMASRMDNTDSRFQVSMETTSGGCSWASTLATCFVHADVLASCTPAVHVEVLAYRCCRAWFASG